MTKVISTITVTGQGREGQPVELYAQVDKDALWTATKAIELARVDAERKGTPLPSDTRLVESLLRRAATMEEEESTGQTTPIRIKG